MSEALSDSEKLAIREEVERRLARIAAFFGAANLLVVLGAIWVLWQTVTSQAEVHSERIAKVANDKAFERLDLATSRHDAAVANANRLIGRLEVSAEDLAVADKRIAELNDAIALLEDNEAVVAGATFLNKFQSLGEKDATLIDTVASIDAKLRRMQENLGSIEAGSVKLPHQNRPTTEAWQEVLRSEVFFQSEFSAPPRVFLSITGIESYSRNSGTFFQLRSENVRKNGFELVLYSAYAASFSNATVSWLAVDTAFQ